MGDVIQFRIDPLEKQMYERVAMARGESLSDFIRSALEREIESPAAGRLVLSIDPKLAMRLLDRAARMGKRSEELVAALLRDNLEGLRDSDVDPDLRMARARKRAEELLRA